MNRIFILLFFIFSTGAFAQKTQVSASFTPDTVRPNDVFAYVVELKNLEATLDFKNIPIPADFKYIRQEISSQMAMSFGTGGGGVSERTQIIKLLFSAPQKEGEYKIDSWKLNVNNIEHVVNSASIKVDSNAKAVIQSQQNVFGNNFGSMRQQRQPRQQREVDLNAVVSSKVEFKKGNIYVGESIPCDVSLIIDKKALSENGLRLVGLQCTTEKADDFSCTGFPSRPQVDESDAKNIFVKYKTLITPNKAGNYQLAFVFDGVFESGMPTAMDMDVFSVFETNFFGRQIPFKLPAQTENLTINPLPIEGCPDDFTGAIGKFSIEKLEVDSDSISVGEPCTLKAKIIGRGNFDRISAPQVKDDENWKVYKPKSEFIDESNGMNFFGAKNFEYIIVAQKADLTLSPSLSFSYFDTEKEQYVTVDAKPVAMSVAPAKKHSSASGLSNESAQTVAKDGGFEILDSSALTSESSLKTSLFLTKEFWFAQIIILLLAAVFIKTHLNKIKLAKDLPYAKFLSDKKLSAKKSKEAFLFANKNKALEFFNSAKESIQYAIAAKESVEALSITEKDALRLLEKNNKTMLFDEMKIFFEGSNMILYGGENKSASDLKELNLKLKNICAELLK